MNSNIYENLKTKLKKHTFIYSALCVFLGVHYFNKIRKQEKKGTFFILFRGATGDNYLQCLLLNSFIKQRKLENYKILAMKPGAMECLKDIFYLSDIIFISSRMSAAIQNAYLFMNAYGMNMQLPFYWEEEYGFTYNRCRVRMLDNFNFMDTYVYFSFNMNYPITFRKPVFNELTFQNEFLLDNQGIVKGKTVFISPDANSVTRLPVWFWNGIIRELQEKGYHCVVNCNYQNFYRCSSYFPSYKNSVPVLEHGGYFLAIRSGFCDIVSTAKCKKVIIYPSAQEKIDYSFHRTEIEFSGFKKMELLSSDDESLVEISTPLIKNITDKTTLLEGTNDWFDFIKELRMQILSNF